MPFPKIFAPKKSNKPKQLNLREMWSLYRSLQPGLSTNSERYLIDEILQMLDKISVEEFKTALRRMYGDVNFSVTPVELSLLLTKGIKKNNLFDFVDFVKVISGSSIR